MTSRVALPVPQKRLVRSRQNLAWGVMLIAFSIFLVVAALAVVGAHYFVFQSTTPLRAQLQVSRGTAIFIGADLIEQAVRGERDLDLSGVVTTDPQSQAVVTFSDQYDGDRTVATITLRNGASFNARQFVRPRFDLSSETYWVQLTDFEGEFDLIVDESLSRPVVISLEGRYGASARITSPGRYVIDSTDQHFDIANYGGDALIIGPDRFSYRVPASQEGSLGWLYGVAMAYRPALTNVLGEETFTTENVAAYDAPLDQVRPFVWRCNNSQDSGPTGVWGLVTEDARPALRLFRGDGALSHGETLCVQGYSTASGLDVSTFSHMSIRATFKIQPHSLSMCGIAASECPLMLRMDYYPIEDNTIQTWYHGFYASVNPNVTYPIAGNHEAVNLDRWYTYESGNLLASLPPEERPRALLNMRFYASGHEYDVYVSGIGLYVDRAAIPLPLIESAATTPAS